MVFGTLRWGLIVAVFLFFVPTVKTQIIGVDACACQPSSFNLTFDFSLSNENNTIVDSDPGIISADCSLVGDPGVSDFMVTELVNFQILETDQDDNVFPPSFVYQLPFFNGDTISYTFIVEALPSLITMFVPNRIQIFAIGINAAGEQVVSDCRIEFVSDCTVIPEIEEGDSIGWYILVSPKVVLVVTI